MNGSYGAGARLEDHDTIKAELERENEVTGLRTKVRIGGNDTYTAAAIRQDSNRVEFKLKREVETNSGRVKVKVKDAFSK